MLSKLVLAAAAVPLAAAGAVLSADYAVVDVKDSREGFHIVVPVPLSLARMAVSFAPEHARRVEAPGAAQHLALARGVVEELRRQPDFELLRVEERDERVSVRKAGGALVVDVTEREGETVHVQVPLSGAARVLASYDGRGFDTRELIDALREADGEVVHVVDRDTEVSVRIW